MDKYIKGRFFKATREVVAAKDFEVHRCTASIKNIYEVYRNHRFGFASKKITSLCQELSSDIRRGRGLDSIQCMSKDEWSDRVDEVIKQLQYEENFDDEKANEIIVELNGNIKAEIIESVKQKLVYLEAYHKGVISVKDAEIQELKNKMKKKQWIVWISGIIGVIGSFASIISLFIQ